jgi:hypothetical protein
MIPNLFNFLSLLNMTVNRTVNNTVNRTVKKSINFIQYTSLRTVQTASAQRLKDTKYF